MLRYESKKTPGVFLTTDGIVDDKTKTLFVTMEDGAEKAISVATLKRWWTRVNDETAGSESAEEQTQDEAGSESAEEQAQDEAGSESAEEQAQDEAGGESAEEQAQDEAGGESAEEQARDEAGSGSAEGMKMSETIRILESIFDTLNGLYFEGRLVRPVITVQSTPRAYGHCSTKKIWKAGDEREAMYEINIGAEFLNRPIESTAATLLHEMVHLNCMETGISDTCQNGRYHNGTFKKECEARDLAVAYDLTNGHAFTSPTEAFTEKLAAAGVDMAVRFARVMPKARAKAERARTWIYTCPCCGQSFRTAAIVNVNCGDCNMAMERA